ncbi:DEAD/DEAH box helicase family protein [Gordonibacter sp.]|uniref:DEAD/DEAH box helicase family protein n=1 Tax=Gordonibacter sp. TaxID=1968902 RepID=UPI003FA5C328
MKGASAISSRCPSKGWPKNRATALLQHECGVLSAPTGFGKTVIGAYFIAQLKVRTLVIVPGTTLLSQWQERLEAFLSINEALPELLTKTGRKSRKKRSLVGQIGGGKNAPSGIVDIATFQSLLEKSDRAGVRTASQSEVHENSPRRHRIRIVLQSNPRQALRPQRKKPAHHP